MKIRNTLIKLEHFLIKYEFLILALPFSFSAILVTINYALGIAFVPNNFIRYSNYIQNSLFLILIIALGFVIFRSLSSLVKVFISLPLLFYIFSFLVSMLRWGLTSHLVSYLLYFGVLGVPTYLVGVIVAKNREETKLFEGLNRWSFFVSPVILHYIIIEFANIKPIGTKNGFLGVYTYMTIAYMALPFILSWFLTLLWRDRSNNKNVRRRKIVVNVFMILLYWISLLYTGTRGAVLCVLFFAVCVCFYALLVRHNNRFIVLVVASLFFITLFLGKFFPSLKMTRLSRLGSFQHIISDFISVQENINNTTPLLTDPNSIDSCSTKHSSSSTTSTTTTTMPSDSTNSKTETSSSFFHEIDLTTTPMPSSSVNDGVDNNDVSLPQKNELPAVRTINYRLVLFATAIQEIKENPLFGLGPLGYYYKYYPQYPHNIFLELIVECGIVGGLAVVFLIFKFFKFAMLGRKNQRIMLIFLMLTGYIVYYMVSGTVWKNLTLLFFLGYIGNLDHRCLSTSV